MHKRRWITGTLGVAAASLLMGSVATAQTAGTSVPSDAAPQAAPPATVPPGQVVIAAAGADATLQSMGAILDGTNQYNIPTLFSGTFPVPGDANCSDIEYVTATPGPGQAIAPVSAGTGLDALKAQETNPAGQKGCIDIARSSAPPRGLAKDPATFEYYAFALDAVSWGSPSLKAPATLTKAQLKDIYNCNITDWSQLPGGGSGPIQRYFTQVGSGTGSFFQSELLDGQDPLTVSSPSCPPAKRILQSQGATIDPADQEKAILPYSVGAWVFQANNHVNPTLDVRNNVRLGGLTVGVLNASPAEWNGADGVFQLDTTNGGVVDEANVKAVNPTPAYPGIRYMYNTIDTVSPNYAEAFSLVGFLNVPSGTKSPLCSGAENSAILSFGLGPLPTSGNPNGSNVAGATCRKFTN